MRRNIHAEDYKSKAQLKREAQALEDLGQTMVGLTLNVLKKLALPERIFDAIVAAQNMKMAARKRQVQFIERLLREDEDLDLEALQRTLTTYLK